MASGKHLVYEVRSEGRVLAQFSSQYKAKREMRRLRKDGLGVRVYSKWVDSDPGRRPKVRRCDQDTSINVYLKSKHKALVEHDMTFRELYDTIIAQERTMEEVLGDCSGREDLLIKGIVEAMDSPAVTERHIRSVLGRSARRGLWTNVLPDLKVSMDVAVDLQRCFGTIDDPFFLGAYRNGIQCDPDSRDSDLSVQPSDEGPRLCYRDLSARRVYTVLCPIESVMLQGDFLMISGIAQNGTRMAVSLDIADAEKRYTRFESPFGQGWYLVGGSMLLFVWNTTGRLNDSHIRDYDRYVEYTAVYPGFDAYAVRSGTLPYNDGRGFDGFLEDRFRMKGYEYIDIPEPIELRRALIDKDMTMVRRYFAEYPQLAILKRFS